MKFYQTRSNKLRGTSFQEVKKKAFEFYKKFKGNSKRKPYVRSNYFQKEKIFLDLFWRHLFEKKNFSDLMRRIKLYPCALEVIIKSTFSPISKQNPNKPNEILHRFGGVTKNQEFFYVQIKETKNKWLISTFPVDPRSIKI